MKFISIYTVDRSTTDEAPSEHDVMSMGRLISEMQQAGVLLDFGGVDSSGMEFRMEKRGETVIVTDGPFAESKEMVGGFAVLNVASRDEALMWSKRFLECAGDGVSDLHQLADF